MNEGQAPSQELSAQIAASQARSPGLQRAGVGQVQTEKQGELQNFLNRLQKQNARLNELVLMQRDAIVRITGTNPIDEPQPCDTPEMVGVNAEINMALIAYEELLQKLSQLTDRWLAL